jgi:broad specificity phosphatase PhoE
MARIVLIRHGESTANAARRFTHGPWEPLTDRGREEALAAGRFVRERFDPVALYASPFVRALETARGIGAVLGLDLSVVEALREQDFGELRGRPYADYFDDPAAQGYGRWRHRPPGGETLEEVAARAGIAVEALARAHAGQDIVVVSHGGVMAALRGFVLRVADAPATGTPNGHGFVLTWRSERLHGPEPLVIEVDAR